MPSKEYWRKELMQREGLMMKNIEILTCAEKERTLKVYNRLIKALPGLLKIVKDSRKKSETLEAKEEVVFAIAEADTHIERRLFHDLGIRSYISINFSLSILKEMLDNVANELREKGDWKVKIIIDDIDTAKILKKHGIVGISIRKPLEQNFQTNKEELDSMILKLSNR